MTNRRNDAPSLAVPTRGVARVTTLDRLFAEYRLVPHPQPGTQAVLAWGRKTSASMAERVAREHGLPLWRVEDAFLRSLTLGGSSQPLGVVVDDQGIYYDAATPSRLETLVRAAPFGQRRGRAEAVLAQWRAARVSKYNAAREHAPPRQGPYVLVVDQTAGDASIRHGLADARSFARLLQAALDEHPELPVLLKAHPDVIAGRKRGHFESLTPGQAARVTVLSGDAHPPSLLEHAHVVYVVTSQMGFEGLLWGKAVRCFGMPFYAGWGLTRDELAPPARRVTGGAITLDALVHAALIDYPRYLDPETGQRCEVERLIDWMALQRRTRERFPPQIHALAFSRWKKPIVRAFLDGSQVTFVRRPQQVPADATVAVWGRRAAPPQAASVLRLEDGFLRSVGLGADLIWPLSWVVDRRGIYYDATAPSDLEHLLSTAHFDEALRVRAQALRERILALGLTKYNVGRGDWRRPPHVRRVILVPGQVETDASIALGAPRLRSNIALLQAVRRAAPDAHLVYKPHPDVVARLRSPGRGETAAAEHCDEVVVDVPMAHLLSQVDEVHVLTSLAGFEALLRGLTVVTYGCPFYAGWGLTTDHETMPRRTRRLDVDELVAGALILYPTYRSRRSGGYTTAEQALTELQQWRQEGATRPNATQRALRWLRREVLGGWSRLMRR